MLLAVLLHPPADKLTHAQARHRVAKFTPAGVKGRWSGEEDFGKKSNCNISEEAIQTKDKTCTQNAQMLRNKHAVMRTNVCVHACVSACVHIFSRMCLCMCVCACVSERAGVYV